MSFETFSITTRKELIEAVQHLHCRSGSRAISLDNDFCSSDPDKWPIVDDDPQVTRLTYPAEPGKPSVPGVEYLCTAHLSWYAQAGCSEIAKEIAKGMGRNGSCPVSVDPQEFIDRILARTPRNRRRSMKLALDEEAKKLTEPYKDKCEELSRKLKSIQMEVQRRCGILYDDGDGGGRVFNSGRADDLKMLADYCRNVQELAFNKAKQGASWWRTFIGGGGAAGAIGFAAYLIVKAYKAIRKGGQNMRILGMGVNDFAEGVNSVQRGIKRFLSVSLPNAMNTLRYVVTLRWLRGIGPPADVADSSDLSSSEAPRPAPPAGKEQIAADITAGSGLAPAVEDHMPSASVVLTQFSNLINSDRYREDGNRFARLTELARQYLAHEAINRWSRLPGEERRQYIADDERLTEGKLPVGFLLKVARHLLDEKMLPIIEGSARLWAERDGLLDEFRLIYVKRQFIDYEILYNASAAVQDYVARFAIAKWDAMPEDARASFINVREEPLNGLLPQQFISQFISAELSNWGLIERKAMAFAQIIYANPPLAAYPFDMLDARATLLIRAWDGLGRDFQSGFWMLVGERAEQRNAWQMPPTFIKFMDSAMEIASEERIGTTPSPEPWRYETAPRDEFYGFVMRDVMRDIIEADGLLEQPSNIRHYPGILVHRARSTVGSWRLLDEFIRRQFFAKDSHDSLPVPKDGEAISRSFTRWWHRSNQYIGIDERTPLAKPQAMRASVPFGGKGDAGKGRGNGGGTPTGGPPAPAGSAPSAAGMPDSPCMGAQIALPLGSTGAMPSTGNLLPGMMAAGAMQFAMPVTQVPLFAF